MLIALATLIWVPIGVWIGLRPKLAERIQPLAQFLAAFPANLAFPVFVVIIVRFGLSPNIWLSPLMILGTQWYILFNVIAGASAFPSDLREAAGSFPPQGLALVGQGRSCPASFRITSPAPSPPRADRGTPRSSRKWRAGATPI